MKSLFDIVSQQTAKTITIKYSTSFSLGVGLLHKSIRPAIYSIYGFVRIADEIVDSFHDFPKAQLLARYSIKCFSVCSKYFLHRY